MKGTPVWPIAVAALLITGLAGLTVSVNVFVPVPLALIAFRVTLVVAVVVGVPEMSPVAVLTVNPAGSPVAPKLDGELAATI